MQQLHPAVKAVILNENKFLLVKQDVEGKEIWDLPGGKVEFKESPYDTLKREVLEEVNLSVEIGKPLGVFWFFRKDGDQIVCTTFECSVNDCDVDLTQNPTKEKITEYKWMTKEEFLNGEYPVVHSSMKELLSKL